MWSRDEIKAQGKAAFKANYWKCVLVGFLLTLLYGGTTAASNASSTAGAGQGAGQAASQAAGQAADQAAALQQQLNSLPQEQQLHLALAILSGISLVLLVSFVLKIFVFNPLKVGCREFFVENVEQTPAGLHAIGTGFRSYGKTFVTLLLTDLLLGLWALLLIVPFFIKVYSYRMVPYILAEHPDMSPMEIIKCSCEMMNGHKWNVFLYDLSFIGWYLLSVVTFGLAGIFWTKPYKESADAALYLALL